MRPDLNRWWLREPEERPTEHHCLSNVLLVAFLTDPIYTELRECIREAHLADPEATRAWALHYDRAVFPWVLGDLRRMCGELREIRDAKRMKV